MQEHSTDYFDKMKAMSGEAVPRRMAKWIDSTRKKLTAGRTPQELLLDFVIKGIELAYGPTLFGCKRQKPFIITPEIVFFVDFYFKTFHLGVEIDGGWHYTKSQREKDEWRSRLIGASRIQTIRFHNYELAEDPVGVTYRIVDAALDSPGRSCVKRTFQNLQRRWPLEIIVAHAVTCGRGQRAQSRAK